MNQRDIDGIIDKISKNHNLFNKSIGYVESINNGVALVIGLLDVAFYEVVHFSNGLRGVVISMNKHFCNVCVLSKKDVYAGMEVTRGYQSLNMKASLNMIGKVFNGYGEGEDLGEDFQLRDIEIKNLGMLDIVPVKEQVVTGVGAIDWFCPIGYGQRETVVSPKFIGEDSIMTFTMLNLKNQRDTIFIYAGIGQKIDFAPDLRSHLLKNNVNNFVMFIANASDEAIMRDLCPFYACAAAEYFKDLGYKVIIFYHDLTQHAFAHREIALMTRTPVGREAYPADITYIHSRLLERAANFPVGSITAIPFVVGELSGGYIQTNVISITDGQLVLSEDQYQKGQKPPVNIGQSVSRIGYGIQNPYMRKLCGTLKLKISRAEQLYVFSQFGDSVSEDDKALLKLRETVLDFLNQKIPYPLYVQILMLYGIVNHALKVSKKIFVDNVFTYEDQCIDILEGKESVIRDIINKINMK